MNGSESIVEVKNLTITDSATDRVIAAIYHLSLKVGNTGVCWRIRLRKDTVHGTVEIFCQHNCCGKAINLLCSETIITKFLKMKKGFDRQKYRTCSAEYRILSSPYV